MADQLTDAEAAVLRLAHLDIGERAAIETGLQLRHFIADDSLDGDLGEMLSAGRAALAAYDAQKRREILRPALELLETVDDAAKANGTVSPSGGFVTVTLTTALVDAIRDLLAKEAP